MRKSIVVGAALALAGCASLNATERQQYENLRAQGAPEIRKKSPTAGALLNVLPGFGDIYNGQGGAFALDFLMWPISVVWAIPQGATTAGNLNKRETIAHYLVGQGQGGQFDPNRYTAPPPRPKSNSEMWNGD